jgi:hypothetical protein
MNAPETATIVLTIIKDGFKSIPSPQTTGKPFNYTDWSALLVTGGTNRVAPTTNDPKSFSVKLKKSHQPIQFQIQISPGDNTDEYRPIGIAFTERARGENAERGEGGTSGCVHDNFPETMVNIIDNVVSFYDICYDKCDKSVFDFYILVQSVNSGSLGIIDPGIVHDETLGKGG